jgi:hypothetical protein
MMQLVENPPNLYPLSSLYILELIRPGNHNKEENGTSKHGAANYVNPATGLFAEAAGSVAGKDTG